MNREVGMKALRLEEFGRLDIAELPVPTAGPGEVLIRVIATGICGSDIHGYTGDNGRRRPGQVMGHETVGRIEALGEGVRGLEPGALVTVDPVVIPAEDAEAYAGREQHHPRKYVIGVAADVVSAFAQFFVAPARNVVVLPEEMPVGIGALIEPFAVAVHAVRRAGVAASDAVVVLGGGPIGQLVVLALRMAGVERILVSEVAPERRALLEALGAETVDPRDGSVPEAVAARFGAPADVAVDAVGISATLKDALLSTRLGAVVCLVGMGSPALDLDAYRVSTEERAIVGSFTYSDADFRDAAAWLADAPLDVTPLISREVPMSEADAAFRALAAGDGTPGKVLVRLDRED